MFWYKLTISGKDGDDAKRYLEKAVQDALKEDGDRMAIPTVKL